jgi:2-methylcitrate dehydratase PrpD
MTGPAQESWSWQLAEWLAGVPVGGFPAAVGEQGARILADSIAAIVAGMQQPEVRALVARLAGRDGPASVLASGARAAPDLAAFLNAVAGTSVETDEGNYEAGGHPAIHVVPTALAVAEAMDASGPALLDAVILGYEGGARIGRATRLRRAVHGHGTWGTIGSAIAAARLRGFDGPHMHMAIQVAATLPVATSRTSGLVGATVRNVYAGVGVRNGILACDLVEAGFTGESRAVDIILGQVLGEHFDPRAITNGLGDDWVIQRNFFKFAACCRETHGALEALEAILAIDDQWAARPADIAQLDIATFADAAALRDPEPGSSLAARFSIPFAIATRLVRGHAGVQDFGDAALADGRIKDLARRVGVREDPSLTALVPRQRITRLTVTLAGGATLNAEVSGANGDFDRPFSPVQFARKFMDLTGGVWGDSAGAILDACLLVGSSPSSRSLGRRLGNIGAAQ